MGPATGQGQRESFAVVALFIVSIGKRSGGQQTSITNNTTTVQSRPHSSQQQSTDRPTVQGAPGCSRALHSTASTR